MSGETLYVVMKLPRPAVPPDTSSLVFGGSLRSASHVAELCYRPTLPAIRHVARLMKVAAAAQGVKIRFAKLRRGSQLYDWAERADAKLIVPIAFSQGKG